MRHRRLPLILGHRVNIAQVAVIVKHQVVGLGNVALGDQEVGKGVVFQRAYKIGFEAVVCKAAHALRAYGAGAAHGACGALRALNARRAGKVAQIAVAALLLDKHFGIVLVVHVACVYQHELAKLHTVGGKAGVHIRYGAVYLAYGKGSAVLAVQLAALLCTDNFRDHCFSRLLGGYAQGLVLLAGLLEALTPLLLAFAGALGGCAAGLGAYAGILRRHTRLLVSVANGFSGRAVGFSHDPRLLGGYTSALGLHAQLFGGGPFGLLLGLYSFCLGQLQLDVVQLVPQRGLGQAAQGKIGGNVAVGYVLQQLVKGAGGVVVIPGDGGQHILEYSVAVGPRLDLVDKLVYFVDSGKRKLVVSRLELGGRKTARAKAGRRRGAVGHPLHAVLIYLVSCDFI